MPNHQERGDGNGWPVKFPQLHHVEWLRARRREGLGAREIADLVGCSMAHAHTALVEAGLHEVRRVDAVIFDPSYILDVARTVTSFNGLAKELEVTRATLAKVFIRVGLERAEVEPLFLRVPRHVREDEKRHRAQVQRMKMEKRAAEIERLYREEGYLMREIAAHFGVDISVVSRTLKQRRSRANHPPG